MKLTSALSGCRALTLAALLSLPTMSAAQQTSLTRALTAQATRQGLRDLAVTSQYTDPQTGLTHPYLRQRHQGIEVYEAVGGRCSHWGLVIEGLKLQPCRPGFLDGRNTILKADSMLNNAANLSLIWQVFARCGMALNAV